MNKVERLVSVLGVMGMLACGSSKPPLNPQVAAVAVSEAAPPNGYVAVKALRVSSGKGCGVFGEPGSVEDGYDKLRAEAAKLGATYVRVSFVQKPPVNHQCREHEHKLGGVAYRAPSPAPVASATATPVAPAVAATPSAAPAPSASPPPAPASAPAQHCIPGSTQACLGPGACQGAQACREDGGGYMPCDCGSGSPTTPSPK
jgi:hypothetical protein